MFKMTPIKRKSNGSGDSSLLDSTTVESPKKQKFRTDIDVITDLDSSGLEETFQTNSWTGGYEFQACQPLQNQLILSVLFQHLSLEDMKSCRSVCHLWNKEVMPHFKTKAVIELDMTSKQSGRTAEDFMQKLMKYPATEFPSSSLHITGIDFFNWDLRQVFNLYGESLKSLTLDAVASTSDTEIKLDRKHLIRLAHLCPNLESLELRDLPDHIIDKGFPKLMKTLMKDCFSNLKRFCFQSTGYFCCLDAQFIMDIMDFAPNLIELSFSVGDDDALDEIITALELRRELMEQIQKLKFGSDFGNTVFETHVQTLLNMKLNIRHLEINSLGSDVSAQSLTWLLEDLSHTLEVLKIGELTKTMQTRRGPINLRFPEEMEKLRHLEICDIGCIEMGSIRFLERLPNLETCILRRSDGIMSVMNPTEDAMFWRTLFPDDSKMDGFRHNHLIDLLLPKNLADLDVVNCIKEYLPSLRRLSLNVTGPEMLPGIIDKLKDSKIEELFLRIVPTESEFDADITGIPVEACEIMSKERSYWPIDLRNKLKVWSSFADWKCLRKLSMVSKTVDYHLLTGVALFHGFAQARNLTSLELGNFAMRDVFILELLNKMPLSTFKLIACNVIASVWGGASGIHDRIRMFFPSVDFFIDPPTPGQPSLEVKNLA